MLVKDDMCGSCFSKTKYTCGKCQIPICNKYSTFEDNEASSRWTAEKCVAYWKPCFKENTLEQKCGGKIEQHKKLDGPDLSKEPEKYVLQLLL